MATRLVMLLGLSVQLVLERPLVGCWLIYGAFNKPLRSVAVTLAGLNKCGFLLLVLMHRNQSLAYAFPAVILESTRVMVIFGCFCFWRDRSGIGESR